MKHTEGVRKHPSLLRQFRFRLLFTAGILFFLVLFAGTTRWFVANYQSQQQKLYTTIHQETFILRQSMNEQQLNARAYTATVDPIFLSAFQQERVRFLHTYEHLHDLAPENEQHQLLQVFNVANQWYTRFALPLVLQVQVQQRTNHDFSHGDVLFAQFQQSIQELLRIQASDQQNSLQRSLVINFWALLIIILLVALIILLLVKMLIQLSHLLDFQLSVLSQTAQQLALGNYQARVPDLKHIELQELGDIFNQMINTLQQQQFDLRQAEQNFRTMIDSVPQMVWVINADGTDVEYCNQKWLEYTGQAPGSRSIERWRELIHPDDMLISTRAWRQAYHNKTDFEVKYRIQNGPHGSFRWFLVRGHPQIDTSGNLQRWFGTCTDIEDLKRIEDTLIHANQAQQNFISTVSHEFRTTLTSIQGFSELLHSQDFNKNEIKEFAGDIYSDATRLHRMINDLLDLEKMVAGKMTLNLEELDINILLKEVIERVHHLAPRHTFRSHLSSTLPQLRADRDKLVQVIYNLLSNAIKYSPAGGEILVTSDLIEQQIHVSVQDNGIGIPPEALERIFQPYNRVHAEHTRYIKGTGLGLPIVRQIIEMLGGRVWAESRVSEGTTFHFTLPLNFQQYESVRDSARISNIAFY